MLLRVQDGFNVPPDVPLYVDPGPVTYASGNNPNVIGDGVGTRGSPMPVLANQLDDIPSTAPGWIVPGSPPDAVTAEAGGEPKFRFHFNHSHGDTCDPIRNYGQPNAAHRHRFFNARYVNAWSTFASLRDRANWAAATGRAATTGTGGPYNGTAYWIPEMLDANGNGIIPGMFFGYYTGHNLVKSQKMQRIPRGLRYVSGTNMDDPDDEQVKSEIAAANAQPGTAGRYSYIGKGFSWAMLAPDRLSKITTTDGLETVPWFRRPDGSDPWEGKTVPGCWLKCFIRGANFYDGVNLWSPGGYKHFRPPVGDSVTGLEVGPMGWYHLPELEIVPFYQHQNDYMSWELASDQHLSMLLGRPVGGGESMHLDWLGAWADLVFGASTGWQHECVGTTDGSIPHGCESGTFSADGSRMIGSFTGDVAPDGTRSPQVKLPESYDSSKLSGKFVPPPQWKGPLTLPARV